MSPFAVSPVTAADLTRIAIISRDAFRSSPLTVSYWMFAQDNEEAIYKWRLSTIEESYHNHPEYSYFKCVNTATDKIVAFALWQRPHPPNSEERKANEKHSKEKRDKDDALPKGTNTALKHDFDADTERMRAKYVNIEEDYILRAIATHPEYQGKGCASALLKSGLEKVDAEGRRAFLEATPQGRPIYATFGWRDVDEMVIDLNKYGVDAHALVITCMMRESPNPK